MYILYICNSLCIACQHLLLLDTAYSKIMILMAESIFSVAPSDKKGSVCACAIVYYEQESASIPDELYRQMIKLKLKYYYS